MTPVCLILFAHNVHPQYRLVVAANRDEFYQRATAPIGVWKDSPELLAGRDLQEGGTWMGVGAGGRFSAITNFREPSRFRADAPTRGRLVRDFLVGGSSPADYVKEIAPRAHQYNGFNLLLGDGDALMYVSNRTPTGDGALAPGVYGVSNQLLDIPWPKVRTGKDRLASALHLEGTPLNDRLFEILGDPFIPPDDQLPDTGVGIEWERILGAIFVQSAIYGTRSSSVVLFDRRGGIGFTEQTFDKGRKSGPRRQFFAKISASKPMTWRS